MDNNKTCTDFTSSLEVLLPKSPKDAYFLFCKDELLVKSIEGKAFIPTYKDIETLDLLNIQSLGATSEYNCFCGELKENISIPENMYFSKIRPLIGNLDKDMFWIAGRAIQIVNWNIDHKYCGRCGSLTETLEGERAKKCPKCGLINYPRLSPAIIVAVVKDGKILLAHNNNFAKDFYSVLAGFVEPGETFEECVFREVYEETGIKVKNIKYFGSQPWPFPNSVMIGFTAEYAEGEIQVDGKEIGHADWFKSNELPQVPRGISISTKLIDWFTENH